MTDRNLEHPAITRAMDYGPPGEEMPCCPVCGEQTDAYYTHSGEVFGCPECLKTVDSWDYWEDF